MQPPRMNGFGGEIVDLRQLQQQRAGLQPDETGRVQLRVKVDTEEGISLVAAAMSEGGPLIPWAHLDGRIALSDIDVERIAQRVVELLASKPTRGQAKKAVRDRDS